MLTFIIFSLIIETQPCEGALCAAPSNEAERIAFLQERLDAGTRGAAIWWYSWTSLYTAGTIGQTVGAIVTHNRDLRAKFTVGAAGMALGVLGQVILPLPAVWAADQLRETTEDKLTRGETLLRKSAEAEAFQRSWVTHLATVLVSVGQGLCLWLIYDLPKSGILNVAIGIPVGEAQIFTQPTRAIDDWREYQQRFLVASPNPPGVNFRFVPFPGGLGMVASF